MTNNTRKTENGAAFGAAPLLGDGNFQSPDSWAYKNLVSAIDDTVALYQRKISILTEMKPTIPKGKTKEYYETVYSTSPLVQR